MYDVYAIWYYNRSRTNKQWFNATNDAQNIQMFRFLLQVVWLERYVIRSLITFHKIIEESSKAFFDKHKQVQNACLIGVLSYWNRIIIASIPI